MGRETFLAKVVWENGWPVVNPGIGMLTEEVEVDLPRWDPCEDKDSYTCRTNRKTCVPGSDREYLFAGMEELGDEFLFLRNPKGDMCRLAKGEGLYLRFGSRTLKEIASPSFVAVRQQHHEFQVEALLCTENLRDGRKAGLALVQSDRYQLRMELGDVRAEVILCEDGTDRQVAVGPAPEGEIRLFLQVKGLSATAGLETEGRAQVLVEDLDIRSLSTEVSGGFVGCCAGLYAVAEGLETGEEALYKSLSYRAL